MKIWVVIPAYNEMNTLTDVVLEVKKSVKNILVVDDASNDKTGLIAKKLGVKLLKNRKNLGYSRTLNRGLRFAFTNGAEYCIAWDADGQHKANNLPKVIKSLKKNRPDLLVGKRDRRNRFMEGVFGWYTKRRFGFSDPLCGIKAYSKSVFRRYKRFETRYTIGTELLIRSASDGKVVNEVEVKVKPRVDKPRFASNLTGNLLELRALANILLIV